MSVDYNFLCVLSSTDREHVKRLFALQLEEPLQVRFDPPVNRARQEQSGIKQAFYSIASLLVPPYVVPGSIISLFAFK